MMMMSFAKKNNNSQKSKQVTICDTNWLKAGWLCAIENRKTQISQFPHSIYMGVFETTEI